MQLKFVLESDASFSLPLQYNHLIQGFIYEAIDPKLSTFLHNQGYQVDGRPFRLFVYSRLFGRYRIDQKIQTITFDPKVTLWISSPLEDFCESMIRNIVRRGDLHLGSHVLHGVEYQSFSKEILTNTVSIQTKSPVTVYSTFLRPEGGKYTAYFQPGEPDYGRLITENLKRKYQAVFRSSPPEGMVSVQADSRLRLNVINYKGFIIKGYSGRLGLNGPPPLLCMALEAGLGAKNSQGFGFIQMR